MNEVMRTFLPIVDKIVKAKGKARRSERKKDWHLTGTRVRGSGEERPPSIQMGSVTQWQCQRLFKSDAA